MPAPKQSDLNQSYVTRESLIYRATDINSAKAWDELISYYEPFVSRVLLGMGLREPDLSDLRQEIFVKLWKALNRFEIDSEKARFRTWFSTLIRNAAFNHFRSAKKHIGNTSLDDHALHSVIGVESELEMRIETEWQRYIVELAQERVNKLFTGKAIRVFELSYDGLSVDEIAEQLGMKKNTVYMLKHRVKTRLLQEIRLLKLDLEHNG